LALQPLGLALEAPVEVLVAIWVVSGIGLAIHLALWFTVFQQHVPEESRSRVSSYDALGSFVLLPLGSAIAGPVSVLIGIPATLLGTFAIEVASFAAIIAQPSVWAIRRGPPRWEANAEAAA
jgi:cation transporter-like permease